MAFSIPPVTNNLILNHITTPKYSVRSSIATKTVFVYASTHMRRTGPDWRMLRRSNLAICMTRTSVKLASSTEDRAVAVCCLLDKEEKVELPSGCCNENEKPRWLNSLGKASSIDGSLRLSAIKSKVDVANVAQLKRNPWEYFEARIRLNHVSRIQDFYHYRNAGQETVGKWGLRKRHKNT